jgi:WD40 repeat protein
LLTGNWDGGVIVWDPVSGERTTSPIFVQVPVGAGWIQDGHGVVLLGADGLAEQWSLPQTNAIARQLDLAHQTLAMHLTPDGQTVVLAVDSHFGLIWHWLNPAAEPIHLPHSGDVRDVGLSQDGKKCYTTADDRTARVWDTESGQPLTPPLPHGAPVRCAAFWADGSTLITGGEDGVIRCWNALNGEELEPLGNHTGAVRCIEVSKDSRYVTVAVNSHRPDSPGLATGFVRCWELPNRRPLCEWKSMEGSVNQLEISPNGSQLVVADATGNASLFSIGSALSQTMALVHQSELRSAHFSSDGRHLLTGSGNGTVRLWDAASGRVLLSGISHGASVQAWFSSDDRWILTAGRDGVAQVWDAATGDAIFPPFKHNDYIRIAAITPDRQWLLTAGIDRCVKVWPLATVRLTLAETERQAALLSGRTVDAAGGLIPVSTSARLRLWKDERAHGSDFRLSKEP